MVLANVTAATLASADSVSLGLARGQTAFSLAFHICFAVFGIGMPWFLIFTEYRWLRTRDEAWLALTKKWSKAFAVLFAVGAVSGTVLSFELGLLWPAFMARYGGALGLSFTVEGFAFFAEAIFLGMYLYGWKRLSPRAHWLTLWPIAIAGTVSTLFIITANAWMNVPTGITEVDGKVVAAEPLAPLLSPGTPAQVVHMLLAALMCTGGVVAAVYAVGMLRGRRDRYHQLGLRIGLAVVLACAPAQAVVGDWAARVAAEHQPLKLAAMEGLYETRSHAPLSIGGIYDEETGELRGAIEIPNLLSLLQGFDVDHVVTGLDSVPPDERPDATLVHSSFTVMVGLGVGLIVLSALVGGVTLYRRRRGTRPALPTGRPWLVAAVATGPAAMLAMLTGWEVTEGGRQPWIVQGRMRVSEAVTTTDGIGWIFAGTLVLYLGLAVALILVLRRMATGGPGQAATPASPEPLTPYPPDNGEPPPGPELGHGTGTGASTDSPAAEPALAGRPADGTGTAREGIR
ncbi:MAG: cytochrome ubiquinol oxidase subunit I [Frankia sp.]|nr:cytochrome ubiquinol oxidase subunit I [Frankia sp.]